MSFKKYIRQWATPSEFDLNARLALIATMGYAGYSFTKWANEGALGIKADIAAWLLALAMVVLFSQTIATVIIKHTEETGGSA